jgi:hypothetical protein
VDEVQLPGGNAGGAVLVDGTVRRRAGPWTATVHSLLRFLDVAGFDAAPRALGIDAQGREILSFLPGETVGDRRPWPQWVHSDRALVDVGEWLRRYHDVVVEYTPPEDARWRMASMGAVTPGDVIGHNDAAPYNAVWLSPSGASRRSGEDPTSRLIGFIDWDFASPCSAVWDLAFVACAWVPLHARDVAASEGFTNFDDRPRRLRLLLDSYRYDGTISVLIETVQARLHHHIRGIKELAGAGDSLFQRQIDDGVITRIERALDEISHDAQTYQRIA